MLPPCVHFSNHKLIITLFSPGDVRRQQRVSPQQWQATCRSANSELRSGMGKGASTQGLRSATRGLRRAASGPRPRRHQPRRRNPPHDTPPAKNNRMAGRQMSCCQQPAPPHCHAAKMSPHISICPEPVLDVHAPSPPAAGSHARMLPGQRRLSSPLQNRILYWDGF